MSVHRPVVAVFVLCVVLAGCGPGDTEMPDAGSSPDTGGTSVDSGGTSVDSGAADAGGSTCTMFTTASYPDQVAMVDKGALYGSASSADGADALSIEAYFDIGGAMEGAQTIPLTGENYADCAHCVLLYTGCEESGECDAIYLASAGTLTYTALTDTAMAGTITDLRMIEVTIDDEFTSTPVPGGRTRCAARFDFDMTAP